MDMDKGKRNLILNGLAVVILFGVLLTFDRFGTNYQVRILNNMAIFITLAVSYNLVNGICGILHLGPTPSSPLGLHVGPSDLEPAEKEMTFIIEPLMWPLSVLHAPLWCRCLRRRPGHGVRFSHQFPGFGAGRLPGHRDPGFGEWCGFCAMLPECHHGPLALRDFPSHEPLVVLGHCRHHHRAGDQAHQQQLRKGHEGHSRG